MKIKRVLVLTGLLAMFIRWNDLLEEAKDGTDRRPIFGGLEIGLWQWASSQLYPVRKENKKPVQTFVRLRGPKYCRGGD